MRSWSARLAAAVAGLVLLTGCGGPTFSDLPLPGNGVSGKTIKVEATFDEALNLAQGASVRINGVDSGRVVSVKAKDFRAVVTMNVKQDAKLRQDATARLRYTTPLGELFVDVTNPDTGALVTDGGSLSPKRMSTAPTVEDALSSASLLINGGGLNQLQTITSEANKALDGRSGTIRDLLARSTSTLGKINASDGDFDRTLRALAKVSATLNARRSVIHSALRDVRPAAKVFRENTANLNALLQSLDRFAGTANSTVKATRKQILRLIRQAQPVLQELVSVRPVFAKTLNLIIKLAKVLDNVIPGDYLNLGIHLELDKGATLTGTIGMDNLVSTLLGVLGGNAKNASTTKAKTKAPKVLPGLDGLAGIGKSVTSGVTQSLIDGLLGSTKKKGSSGSSSSGGGLGGLLGGLLGGGQ
jgi:phospholipid/cholesterol/gamma-HCH transport system substrate-binding protein